jgi:hypothetical protein
MAIGAARIHRTADLSYGVVSHFSLPLIRVALRDFVVIALGLKTAAYILDLKAVPPSAGCLLHLVLSL